MCFLVKSLLLLWFALDSFISTVLRPISVWIVSWVATFSCHLSAFALPVWFSQLHSVLQIWSCSLPIRSGQGLCLIHTFSPGQQENNTMLCVNCNWRWVAFFVCFSSSICKIGGIVSWIISRGLYNPFVSLIHSFYRYLLNIFCMPRICWTSWKYWEYISGHGQWKHYTWGVYILAAEDRWYIKKLNETISYGPNEIGWQDRESLVRKKPDFGTVAQKGLFKKATLEYEEEWWRDSCEKLRRGASSQKEQHVQRPLGKFKGEKGDW